MNDPVERFSCGCLGSPYYALCDSHLKQLDAIRISRLSNMGVEMSDQPGGHRMRQFETGATRDADVDKYDYEGFLSPLVLERYAQYMHKHRVQADGRMRDSDNWQRGIPRDAYMKSGFRHFMDWWRAHRGLPAREGMEEALCALLFNVQGYLHEHLRTKCEEVK